MWWPLGPPLGGSLLLPQGAGQCVPVRGVWPGLPLPQGLAHEPCPQVLRVVSLATRPPSLPALHESRPCQLPGQAWTRRWSALGATCLLSPSRTWPSCCPSLQDRSGAAMTLGSRRARGRDARVPSFGSKEPDAPGQAGLYRPRLHCALAAESGQ